MATYDQVMTALRNADSAGATDDAKRLAQIASGMKSQPSVGLSGPAAIPTGGMKAPASDGNNKTASETTWMDKVLGVGQAAGSVVANAAVAPFAQAAGVAKSVTGGKYGTPEGVKQGEATARKVQGMAYQPSTDTGQRYASNVGEAMSRSGVVGIPMGAAADMGRLAKPAMKQASATVAPLAQKAGTAVADLAAASIPRAMKPAPEVLALAKKAKEYGIPLRPDMLSDNKLIRMIGEASEKVPLSGSKAVERQAAFNKALIGQIGGDPMATKLTPDVFEKAIRTSGVEIGRITGRARVKADSLSPLTTIAEDAAKFETADNAKTITNMIAEVRSKSVNGVIDGTAFRKMDTFIGKKIRSTPDGDLRNNLRQVQDVMRDALNEGLDSEGKTALQGARMKYAKALTLEPLVAKSATGDVSAAGLMGRVTADKAGKSRMARGAGGEMGDLARIGQRFIKEPPSSGTAERGLAYSLMSGGAYLNPYVAAGVYGGASAYNRLGPAFSNLITRPPKP